MGGEQALVASDIGKDAGGLWHGEGQVDASSAPFGIADLLTIGQAALEEILEDLFLHLTGKAEFSGAVSAPATDLAGVLANVIVILGKIVGSAAADRTDATDSTGQNPISMSSPRSGDGS
jgi:hypothetical protein